MNLCGTNTSKPTDYQQEPIIIIKTLVRHMKSFMFDLCAYVVVFHDNLFSQLSLKKSKRTSTPGRIHLL